MTRVDFGQSINGDGNREADVIAAYATTTGLAILAVVLRFVARKLAGAKLWWDDWLILAGLMISIGFTATIMFWISEGLGHYIGLVTPAKLAASYELIFAGELIYLFAIGAVKLSLVAFYWRILAHSSRLRIVLYAFAAINIAWVVALFFTVLFQCLPIAAFWDKTIENMNCGVDLKGMLIGNSIPNFASDVALVCLPLFYIPPRINTSTIQKAILYTIFALGFFVTIAPIVRLALLARLDPHSRNVTWDFVDYVIWTGAEINLGIVAGCLPSLRPVIAKLFPADWVPEHLRDQGRKAWIATPDQSWLNEPVSIHSDVSRLSDIGSQRSSRQTLLLHSRDGSQVALMEGVPMTPMTPLSKPTSRTGSYLGGNGDGNDKRTHLSTTTTVHDV